MNCSASTSPYFWSSHPSLLCHYWHKGRNQARPKGHWKINT